VVGQKQTILYVHIVREKNGRYAPRGLSTVGYNDDGDITCTSGELDTD